MKSSYITIYNECLREIGKINLLLDGISNLNESPLIKEQNCQNYVNSAHALLHETQIKIRNRASLYLDLMINEDLED